MAEAPSFDEYAQSEAGESFPLSGGPIDEIMRLKEAGDHIGAELVAITAGAALADIFAAEEEMLRAMRKNGELK